MPRDHVLNIYEEDARDVIATFVSDFIWKIMTKDKGLLLQSEQRFLFFLQDRITDNKNISDNNEFKKYLQGQSCSDLDLLYTSIKNHMLASFDPNNYDVLCYEVFMYAVQHELNRDQAFRNYVSSTPEKREINFNLLTPEILGLYFAIADNESSDNMAHSASELYIKEIDGEYSKPCLSGISFLVEQNYSFHLGYSLEEMKEVFKLPSRETLEIDASYFKDISELEAGVRNNYIQEYNLNTGDDSNPRLLKNIIYFPVVRPLYNQYFDLIFYSPKLLITFYANNREECKNLLNNKRFCKLYFSVAQKLHGETYSDSLSNSEKRVLREMVFYLLRNNNESFKNFAGEDLSFLEFFQQDSKFLELLACFNEQQVQCLHAIAFGEDWSADNYEKPFSLCLTEICDKYKSEDGLSDFALALEKNIQENAGNIIDYRDTFPNDNKQALNALDKLVSLRQDLDVDCFNPFAFFAPAREPSHNLKQFCRDLSEDIKPKLRTN